MVVGRPRREGRLPLLPGRLHRGGSPYRGGVENGGLWWPEEALEEGRSVLEFVAVVVAVTLPELDKEGCGWRWG